MRYYILSALFLVTTASLSGLKTSFTPRWEDVQVKHSWSLVPDDWTSLGQPATDTTIDLHIALKAQNESALTDALYEVSSLDHSKYGKHLSKEQLEYYGVLPSTILTKHGGSQVTLIGIPVSQANDLLGASYQLYHHIGTNTTVLRTLSYGLPGALFEHVQTIIPTTNFGSPHISWRKLPIQRYGQAAAHAKVPSREVGSDIEYITPASLRSFYRTSAYVPTAANWNVIGVAGFKSEYPSPEDLMIFMKEYRADGSFATYTVVLVKDGAYDPSNPSMEPNIDIQFSFGIAYPARVIFYSIGESPRDRLISWLEYMLDQVSVPQTIVITYGSYEHVVSLDYATYACNLFARLGARGASVLAASGDDGVGPENCQFKDSYGNSYVRFFPTFPSTCPWVTSVGGTMGHDPGVAARFHGGGYSSGGFSAYFPRPLYQDPAVPAFLQNLGGRYYGIVGGRGVPDIALQAVAYETVLNRQPSAMQGTSCAAPAAAGIIALLNNYMISSGRRPLGFLNPWLYGGGLSGLNDITLGSNPGCNTEGFSAIPGWDPVTGLGSLDFARLGELLSFGF
ncbi:peptidase S8/S53 domain-containing protein [Lactarius quietus]|nr:peptidase S8/S53 domain-containing protein [Lactarius quietus]